MCGIVGVFDLKVNYTELRANVLKMSKKVRHRGSGLVRNILL